MSERAGQPGPGPDPVEALLAERAVSATLARYCHTCDDGRFDEFAACFTEDAVLLVLGSETRGRTAIRAWVERAMPAERRGKHVCANSVVEIIGDRALASTDFLFLARDGDGFRVSTAGRYEDELRPAGDGSGRWLFARREILLPPRTPRT